MARAGKDRALSAGVVCGTHRLGGEQRLTLGTGPAGTEVRERREGKRQPLCRACGTNLQVAPFHDRRRRRSGVQRKGFCKRLHTRLGNQVLACVCDQYLLEGQPRVLSTSVWLIGTFRCSDAMLPVVHMRTETPASSIYVSFVGASLSLSYEFYLSAF